MMNEGPNHSTFIIILPRMIYGFRATSLKLTAELRHKRENLAKKGKTLKYRNLEDDTGPSPRKLAPELALSNRSIMGDVP